MLTLTHGTNNVEYTLPIISKENYMEILGKIDVLEVKGQSYLCVAHAYLGALAYTIHTGGWWRDAYSNWKSFCENALKRPYSTVSAAYNNYKFYVIQGQFTLEEYLSVLARIGIVKGTKLKSTSISSKQDLLNIIEKVESNQLDPQTLTKEEEEYAFISFRLEKEKYQHIIALLEMVEKKVGGTPSPHIGERLHNAATYLCGYVND